MVQFKKFYHTKKCEGTITYAKIGSSGDAFYHTKKCEGTITESLTSFRFILFYHTKKCEGTITELTADIFNAGVLPYQEMRGNYN